MPEKRNTNFINFQIFSRLIFNFQIKENGDWPLLLSVIFVTPDYNLNACERRPLFSGKWATGANNLLIPGTFATLSKTRMIAYACLQREMQNIFYQLSLSS